MRCKYGNNLLNFLFLAFYLLCITRSHLIVAEPRKLELEQSLFDELQDGEKRLFMINVLETDVKYEVRISYSAVTPTDFIVEVHPVDTLPLGGRKLLNVEQVQWKAEYKNYQITVRAHRVGVPLDLESLKEPTPFHIVVNRLYFGCSIATWKLLVSCLFVSIVVLKLAYPLVYKFIERIQQDMKAE